MSISFSGLASGLDTSSWIESLVSIKQAKVDSLAEEKKILEQTKNVLSSIRSFFDSFRSTLAKVTDSKLFPGGPLDIFAQNLAISSNTAIATAIATSEAKEATYELKVDNLATNTEAISSYMTTITETTIATENSYLKHLGVKAGTIGIKKDGVSQNLTIDDNDTIGSFIKKLQNMGVEASFSNGIFSVNLGVGDITENDTNIIDALGLQDTNTGYETDIEHSKSLSVQTTETVTVTATGTDKLSDFGVLGGTVTIESAGAEYELTIDNEMTINDFVSAIAENTSAIVNFNENTGEFTLQDAKIVSSAITVSESVNAEGTTVKETKTIQEVLGLEEDVFSVSQMTNPLSYATTITTSTAATRDTLLTDIGLETEVAEGANIVVKNKNNEYTTIELDENSTIGSVLDEMKTAGLTATITDDGTIQISNGIIDTDQSTFDVTSAFGLNETPYTGMVTGDSLQITNENAEKINATSLTELTTLGMTAGEVEFDTSSGTKTITITDTMTIASLQEAMRSVGIATTWDNSTAKLTIKNATVKEGADNANFANTLNLTSNVDSSYTSSNDLYVNVTQSVTTTSATTLGTLGIEIVGEEDLTLHDETGNEIATTVISSETKLEDIIGFVNSYTTTDGVSAGLEGGVLTINGGYISNSTLETGLGMDISSGTSSSIGSVITLTTEGTAGVGNSLKEIISALGTDAETAVAGGYTLTLDGVNVEGIDEDTTITELIGLIEDANTNVSASFNTTTGKLTIVGAEVGGTVATALGISATRQTIGVNGTGNKLYVQTQNTATEDTKLSELGITSGTYTVRDSATGDDKATINIEGTQSIKEMLSIMAETTTNKITGTIDNGVITLNSPDGYYIVGTEVENILGIKTEEITTTISSNATSDSAITFTQSVNAERTTKLEDVISNYSEINKTLTIYDAQGNILATVDTLADTENPIENPTINDLMSVLAANTIQSDLTDGVLTLTSGAGYYATGDILTSLGVGTAPDGLVTITTGQTKTSSSALQATTTITAQASTTISDCITMPTDEGDNRNIIIKDSTGNTVTEIAVGTDMTFTQLSAETDDYGITITASNGSLTLNSTSGHYIDDTAISLALGIQTVDYENGTTTNTISSSTTSSEAITYTQSVNAEETNKLEDVISNYSEINKTLTIYDAQGNTLATVDTLADTENPIENPTINDLMSVLAANTIQAELTDGVLTLTSTAGYYATGDILSAFGIDKIPDGEVTVTVGKAVTSTVALAATMTANRDTTIADCVTMPTNRTILIKDSEGNVVTNGTIVVTDTMTFTQLSAATDDFGITIDIDANGKLTLQNTGSNYIDETAMSTALGIITHAEETTITVGKATTSSGQITVGSVLTTTSGVEQTGGTALTYGGSTTASLSTTLGSVGLTGSEYTLVVKEYNGDIEKSYTYNSGTSFETIKNDLANHGLTLSMADGVISITPTHSGEIGDNKYVEGTLATALGIGKTTNGTDTVIRYESEEKLTYTIEAVTATGSTTLEDITTISDFNIEIKDAVSGSVVATITTITSESSIDNIFSALSAYGINGSISDEGVISLTSDNTYYATGAILEKLGISTAPVAGVTASSSTTLKELNITNAKFNQAITRMTQEEAEAAGYTWVTTREGLIEALENEDSIVLGCDIDLSGEVWNPIAAFANEFNGNGFAIKNMTIDNTVSTNKKGFVQNAGDTTFYNLGFENVTIIGDSDDAIGVFAGAGGYLNLYNCYVDNVNITGGNFVGGIVGDVGAETELKNININNLTISSAAYAGGLLGGIEQGEINIENSSISGNISATYDAGGVIASAEGQYNTNIYISDSKIFTTVSGADTGQIIGYAQAGDISLTNSQYDLTQNAIGQNAGDITESGNTQIGTYTAPIDNFIYIHDAVNGNIVATITNITTESSIDNIFTALNAHGISGSINNGVISLDGNNEVYASGDILDALGVGANTITTQTATSSTTLKQIGFTNFTNEITRMTKEQAEAEGYEWVTTREQLTAALNGSDTKVMLGCDIDLAGQDWTPIADVFVGELNGNGYVIKNMTITEDSANNSDKVGLFCELGDSAYIQNLGFENVNISGSSILYAGVLAATSSGQITIDNCYISNANIESYSEAGGFIADNSGTLNIKNSTIHNSNINGASIAGGLVGTNTGGKLYISDVGIYNTDAYGSDPSGCWGKLVGENHSVVSASNITTKADSNEYIGYSQDESIVNIYNTGSAQNPNRYIYVHDSFGVIIATIDSISTESSIEDIFNALEPYGISGTMVSGSINLNGNGYVSGSLISELGIEATAPTISGITQTGNPIFTPEGSITTSKLTARSYRTVVTSTSVSKPYEVTRDTLLGGLVGATGELEIRAQSTGTTITVDTTATVGELINAINTQAGRKIASLEDGRIMIDNNNNDSDAYVTGTLATALGFVNVTSSNEVVSGMVDSATGSVVPDATTVGSDTTMILTLGSGVLENREREYLHAGMTFDELGLTTTNKITVETKEGNQLTITVNTTDTVGSFISKLDAIDGIKASIADGGYVVIEQLGKAHIATANQAEYQEIFNLLGISHSALATERLITVSETTTFAELGVIEDAELSLTVDGVKIDTGLNANTATINDYIQLINANGGTAGIHEGILTIDYGDEQIGLDARVLNAINDRSAITSFSSMGLAESGTIEGIQGNKRFTIGVGGTDTLYSLNEKLSEFDIEVTIDSLGQFVFGPKAGASNTAITSISDELSEFFQVNSGANISYNKFGEATNTDSDVLYLTPFTKNTSSSTVYEEKPYTKNTASANQILVSEEEIHDVTSATKLSDLGFNTSFYLTVTVMETDTTPYGYASNTPESVAINGNTSISELLNIINGMGMTASFDQTSGKISIQEDLTTFWHAGFGGPSEGDSLAALLNVLKVDDADLSTKGGSFNEFNTDEVSQTLYVNTDSDQQMVGATSTAGSATSLGTVGIASGLDITIWNGTTTTVVSTNSSESFEDWFERLGAQNITGSINESTGIVSFTPKDGTSAYIIGMDDELKSKLGITGDFYETNTTDNTRSLSASDTFGNVLTKNAKTYDASKATITYMLNGEEKTFTLQENETFETAGLRLAQDTSGDLTLSVDNATGKVTITGSNNAYVTGFGDDVASCLKLSAGPGTTWETQTLNGGSNTVSGPTLTIGGGGISPDTKLGDIGFSGTGTITVFNGTSPQEIVVTGDTKLSELSTLGITATVSDNKVTLTPDGNGYIQSISNNLAGVLKISSGNNNTYTTESKTLYKNSESDVIQVADPDATAQSTIRLQDLSGFSLNGGTIGYFDGTEHKTYVLQDSNEDGNITIAEFVNQIETGTNGVLQASYNADTGILNVYGTGGAYLEEVTGGVQFKDAFNLGETTFETEEITTTTAGSNSITTPPNADANGRLSGVVSGNATGGTKLAELGLNSEGTVGKIVYFDGNKLQEIDATKNTTIEGLSSAGLTVSVDNNGIVTIDLGANCYIESITTDLANALGISGPYYTTEVKTTSGNTASKVLQVGNPGVTAGDNIKLNQLENFDLGNGKIRVYNATTGANEDITITSGNLSIQEFVSQVNNQTDAVSLSYNEASGILTVSGVGGSTMNEIAGGVQFKDAFNLGEPTFETETVTRNSVSNNLSETSTVKASNTNMLTALETATGAKLEFIDDTVTLELSTTSTTGASFTTNLVFTTADSLETVAETLLDYGITMTVSNTTGEVKFSAGSLSDFDFNGALGEYLKGDNYTESNSQVIITNKSVSLDAATPRIMGEADSISELGTTLEEGTIQVIQNGQATNVEFTTAGISTTDDVLDFFRGLGFEAEIVAGKVKLNSNDGKSLASVDGGSNVLKVFGLENWSISGFQQTSDTILKDDVTTTKVTSSMINSDDSVKLSDLTNSSGTLLGDMSGTIYINDNGAQTKEITIGDNTTVKDLINELGNDFNVAVNNGKLSITSTGNKKLESGTSSLLTNLGINDWTYTQTSTSKTLDYVDSNSDTVNIDEKAKLKEIDTDYKAGYISVVKADGNVDNIKLSEEESIESLLKRLEAYDITGYVDPDGQVVLNSSGAYLTAYTTNTEEASNALEILGIGQDKWHLSNNYESKAPVMDIDTEDKTLAADRETELKDLITDFKGGEYYIYNNGVRYTAVLSDDAKLGDFIDQLETFNIQVGLTGTETEASKLTLLGTGNTYIATSQNTSNASNITELFAEGKTEMMTYGGAIDKEVIEVTTTGITEDFKLKDLDPTLDVTGKFTITVNGSACEIDITENDTIGTFISKLDKVGVKASLSEDGTAFRIESGFNTISIDTTNEGTTKNLAEALGLGSEQKAFGGYSVSDKTVYQTIEYTERISPANFASEGTALETLGISAGSFTVYRDGQKATITIENGETFGSLEGKIQAEFGTDDVVLTFTPNKPNGLDAEGNPITTLDGVLRIYSTTEGVEIKTGSVSDTSNFSAIVGLRTDENSNGVRSSREMYCVNGNTKLTTENLFRTGNITEGFFVIGDAEFEITEETTLNNLIAQINSNDKAGATAYWDNIKGQFVIKSKDSGASLLNIESGSLDGNKTASNFTDILGFTVTENGVSKIVTQSQDVGQNANFSIDGTKFTSTSNTIDSSISRIEGLTIELKEVTPEGETVTIKVEKDDDTLANVIEEVIASYNQLMSNIDKQIAMGGALHDETTLKYMRDRIWRLMTSSEKATSVFRNLDSIGISTAKGDGANVSTGDAVVQLEFDKEKFSEVYRKNPNDIKELLLGSDKDGDGEIKGIEAGVFTELENLITEAFNTGGYFTSATNSFNNKISTLNTRISKANQQVERYRMRLEKKFSAMDLLIGNIQNQYSSFLGTSFGGLG